MRVWVYAWSMNCIEYNSRLTVLYNCLCNRHNLNAAGGSGLNCSNCVKNSELCVQLRKFRCESNFRVRCKFGSGYKFCELWIFFEIFKLFELF